MYIKYCTKFSIRADGAFAQMCHETGLLVFTGTAKPDWNNFAGVGITGPTAVQKFNTEDLGVIAHIAHLSWYLFKDHVNSLCSRQFDPRHFESEGNHHPRYNGDVTLNHLNGNWAPSPTYTDKIIRFLNIINGEKEIVKPEPEPEPTTVTSTVTNNGPFDVIVQMGHQGKLTLFPKMTGTNGERIWTEKLGNAMKSLLEEAKINYRLMGAEDWLPEVPNKTKIFLSLHFDGSLDPKSYGFTLGYKPKTDPKFKETIAISYGAFSRLHRRTDNCTGGLRLYYMWTNKSEYKYSKFDVWRIKADYYCLLEHCFFTNPTERKWAEENINGIAKHHVMVIKNFLKDLK
jgi:hypothetical protein